MTGIADRSARSTRYLDFDLVLEKAGAEYRARVVSSPGGIANCVFKMPFTPADLAQLADQFDESRRTRRIATPQLSFAKDLGGRLYQTIFVDDLRASLGRARDQADDDGLAGVRIRIHLAETPELAVFPWELLFDPDPRVSRFLALADDTPLIRYIDLPDKIRPLRVAAPIRVLGVVSNPLDDRYPELDVEREWKLLDEALAPLVANGLLELVRMPNATVSTLQDHLATSDSNVLHFIGHGRFDEEHQDGVLAFEGERGGVNEVGAERLGALLYNEKSLRLVVLNACEGGRASPTDPYAGMAQTLVRMRVPAVVAMQFEITDRAAIVFARQFYRALAMGRPVDAAITDARMAIYQQVSEVEWATPVLYMRAPDGAIFDVASTSTTTAAPTKRVGPSRVRAVLGPLGRWRRRYIISAGVAVVAIASAVLFLRPPVIWPPAEASPSLGPDIRPSVVTLLGPGKGPDGIAIDAVSNLVYVVNGKSELIQVFDLVAKKALLPLPISGGGVNIAFDPAHGRIYVTQYDVDTVAVIDVGTREATRIPVGDGPFALAIDPDTHKVYVTNQLGNSVSIIDPSSLGFVKTITGVGETPVGIAIDPSTHFAYVANLRGASVTVIDTQTDAVVRTLRRAAAPGRVAACATGGPVLITNPDEGSVTILDGVSFAPMSERINVGLHPLGVVVGPACERAYVAVQDSSRIAVIDLKTNEVAYVDLDGRPANVAYSATTGELFVSGFNSDKVWVLR